MVLWTGWMITRTVQKIVSGECGHCVSQLSCILSSLLGHAEAASAALFATPLTQYAVTLPSASSFGTGPVIDWIMYR